MNKGREARCRWARTWQEKGSISATALACQPSGAQATDAASIPLQTLRDFTSRACRPPTKPPTRWSAGRRSPAPHRRPGQTPWRRDRTTIWGGTDDARILRVDPGGGRQWLTGFDAVEGRDKWYAGQALVDGKLMGPPLGIRSMAATCDGAVFLANVHVGGIPRSTDAGLTWRPTIDIDSDVHQVCAHPTRPDLVIAAAAAVLCVSRDAGATWAIESHGLHAPHCSAVAFGRNDLFVSASVDPFSEQGVVYRRPIYGNGPLQTLGGGMPRWTDGAADTDCIATRDSMVAVIDKSGCLYVSYDDGATWSCPFDRLNGPGGLHIC